MIEAEEEEYETALGLIWKYDPKRPSELQHLLDRGGFVLAIKQAPPSTLDDVMEAVKKTVRDAGFELHHVDIRDPNAVPKPANKPPPRKVRKKK